MKLDVARHDFLPLMFIQMHAKKSDDESERKSVGPKLQWYIIETSETSVLNKSIYTILSEATAFFVSVCVYTIVTEQIPIHFELFLIKN